MFASLTYQIYEEYSTRYIIDLVSLDNFVKTTGPIGPIDVGEAIEPWLETNCYQIIPTALAHDFQLRIQHNLALAKQKDDHEYVQYICKKLLIDIDQVNWTYNPRKIPIKLKSSATKTGFTLSKELAQLLSITENKIYKYKSEITRMVHQYIYQNELQNRYDRKVITPDDPLQSILLPLQGEIEYNYINLPKYIPVIALS